MPEILVQYEAEIWTSIGETFVMVGCFYFSCDSNRTSSWDVAFPLQEGTNA